MPQIRKFVESGGSVVTIGSSTSMAETLGIPVTNYMTEDGSDRKEHPLPQDKFYVPGSLLRIAVDTTNPLAYGMPDKVDVFFDSSPVFKLGPDAALKHTSAVGCLPGRKCSTALGVGQQYLDGGTAIAEASVGEGKWSCWVPKLLSGAAAWNFKFLFNGLYLGSAENADLNSRAAAPDTLQAVTETTWKDDEELFSSMRERLFTAAVGDVLDTMGFLHQFLPPGIAPLRQDMVVAGRAMPVLEADCFGRGDRRSD